MMKNLTKCIVFAVIFMSGLAVSQAADKTATPPATAAAATTDEAKLRELVIQVIKDNPKLILDTVNDYVKEQQKVNQAQQKAKEAQELEESFKKPLNDPVAENVPVKGPEKARITIIEYSDFQCPYCSKGAELMKDMLTRYPEKVKVAFKNNPLNFHPQALPASKAALAANKQGKFWEYHDLLFQNSAKLSEELFVKFAQDLKLDMTKFEADRKSEDVSKQIEAEMNKAKELGLQGTPSFLINGVVVRGVKGPDHFVSIIDRLLAEPEKK